MYRHRGRTPLKGGRGSFNSYTPMLKPTVLDPAYLPTTTVEHSSPVAMTICGVLRVLSGGCFLIGRGLQSSRFQFFEVGCFPKLLLS